MTDALLNYETVKVFGNEEYERNELDQCIMKYQDVEYKLMASLNGLNVLQSIIIFSGLIAGLMVCVKVRPSCASPAWACMMLLWQLLCQHMLLWSADFRSLHAVLAILTGVLLQGVADGRLTVGDAVLFITLMQVGV